MKKRQSPMIFVKNSLTPIPSDVREIRARETLRLVIGDEEYRDFLKKGFVSVYNKASGRTYQIFPGHKFTNVYEGGKLIEKLCVVLSGDFPPTDSLIVRYLMILNNEERLWQLANKHGAYIEKSANIIPADNRSLIEIYNELKMAA
jgi:hypothetical protein